MKRSIKHALLLSFVWHIGLYSDEIMWDKPRLAQACYHLQLVETIPAPLRSNQLEEGRTIWLRLVANETQLAGTRFSSHRKWVSVPPSLEPFQTLGQSVRRVEPPKALREHNRKSGHLWESYWKIWHMNRQDEGQSWRSSEPWLQSFAGIRSLDVPLFAKFRDSVMQVVRCNCQHPIFRARSKFCFLVLFTLCDLAKQTKHIPCHAETIYTKCKRSKHASGDRPSPS